MISERQNQDINIQRLAAQRHIYSEAKKLYLIRLILMLPAILILTIIVAILKSKQITSAFGIHAYDGTWILAFVSAAILFLDFLFLHIEQKQKKCAATIQEEFDCEVMQLPWNNIEIPRHPLPETIIINAKAYLRKHTSEKLYNWYSCPNESIIPLNASRVICQRASITYDSRLREKYINRLLILGVISIITIMGSSLLYDISLRGFFISVIVPILPILKFVVGEIIRNRSTINILNEISECIESLWEAIISNNLSDEEYISKSRHLQDRIFANRKDSSLIPDKLYNKLRPSYERVMALTAQQMINQYIEAKKLVKTQNNN